MSHQDRKSKEQIVVNHESLKQAVNSLLTAAVFRGVRVRKGCKWTARMLVTVALFWAWSAADGLKERFHTGSPASWPGAVGTTRVARLPSRVPQAQESRS